MPRATPRSSAIPPSSTRAEPDIQSGHIPRSHQGRKLLDLRLCQHHLRAETVEVDEIAALVGGQGLDATQEQPHSLAWRVGRGHWPRGTDTGTAPFAWSWSWFSPCVEIRGDNRVAAGKSSLAHLVPKLRSVVASVRPPLPQVRREGREERLSGRAGETFREAFPAQKAKHRAARHPRHPRNGADTVPLRPETLHLFIASKPTGAPLLLFPLLPVHHRRRVLLCDHHDGHIGGLPLLRCACAVRGVSQQRMFANQKALEAVGDILEEMEPVGDLPRVGRSLPGTVRIRPASTPADNRDGRMATQPRREGFRSAVGQQINDVMRFEVDEDRTVGLPFALRPVVQAQYPH